MSKHSIKQAAVIGAGTMGSRIAAVIAGTDTKVLLLDIVPKGANDRDILAKKAIEKLKDSGKSLFSEQKAANIQPGNMEDDLDKLKQVDWVIECVPEKEEIKHETYEKIGQHVAQAALVSSNTSTIPLRKLREGLDKNLQRRMCITHFFNPPTVMPLLEVVTDQDNDPDAVQSFVQFADEQMGKNVVMAKDTPGFIGNRIGIFWMLCAMEEAKREGVSIEMADAVMNGAFGFPKTGVFALADLIGLKIIPDIAKSMCKFLPGEDAFCQLKDGLGLIDDRIKESGEEKGKPGFYHKTDNGKQVFDLKKGEYREAKPAHIEIKHWHEFLSENKPESRFAGQVLMRLLGYTSQVAPDIAESILDVDIAMRDGFGWKYGPFEMIDRLGASWLADQLTTSGMHPSSLLQQAEEKGFYPQGREKKYLGLSGRYRVQNPKKGKWTLALKTAGEKPVWEGKTAKLWDIGDGIACFEMTAKMGVIGPGTLEFLVESVEKAENDFTGLIIGHDGKHFSAGFDLHTVLDCAKKNDWKRLDSVIRQGQQTMLRVKQSRVPVIAAIFGYTLGGACEMTMHCAGAQAHSLVHIGLVEIDIGVIPAWGGTKEHLWDAVRHGGKNPDDICAHALRGFREIAAARKSNNAEHAFDMELLHDPSRITTNRERLLPDAKALALRVAKYYQPRHEEIIEAPTKVLHERFVQEVQSICEKQPDMDMHRKKALHKLAEVMSGFAVTKSPELAGLPTPERNLASFSSGDKDSSGFAQVGWDKISEQQMLDATREAFMELVQTKEALEKIKKVVKK